MNTKLPSVRNSDLVVQNLGDEILIYDLSVNKAYCLNKTAATVYNACAENLDFEDLKSRKEISEEIIYFSIKEFQKLDLLKNTPENFLSFENLSRREVIKKVGLSSMLALPVVYSLVAPIAVSAQSASLYTCSNPGASTSVFCVSSPTDCTSGAKTQCATCGASASTTGLCSANTINNITCTCGAVCSNPGSVTSSFCASPATGCSQARDLCRNCSATGSTTGLCSANAVDNLTCTCV